MIRDFDVIVIGSGAGGGTFAHRCATAGKRVLLLERGRDRSPDHPPLDEQTDLIDKRPYDDRPITVNDTPRRLYMGSGPGGSTAVFGGAMLRPLPGDFQPGRHYAAHLDRTLWDWPIEYNELAPFFAEAETMFRVNGPATHPFSPGDRTEPGQHAGSGTGSKLLSLAPINQRLIAANQSAGLNPFQLPLAIDSDRCARCASCAGFLCPNNARRSAGDLVAEAYRGYGLVLKTNAEVERLHLGDGGRIDGVIVRDRETDRTEHFRADGYALAAGAIGSPAILLKSGIDGPHIGRNYMMHYSPIVAGLFAGAVGASETFIKQVGFADFYFGTPGLPEKMGLVQSLPAPGPLMLKKTGLGRVPAWLLNRLRARMVPLAGIVEDLPRPENRVVVKPSGAIGLEHSFSDFDRERGIALAREMACILKRTGAMICKSKAFPSEEHVAHQCGTLRFGTDPRHAATATDGRLFGHPNLFVVDGSLLPTSTGVGPSLMIAANALRIANLALTSL